MNIYNTYSITKHDIDHVSQHPRDPGIMVKNGYLWDTFLRYLWFLNGDTKLGWASEIR